MSIIQQLSSSLNRKDEAPNIQLAQHICKTNDSNTVKELIENLNVRKYKNDCIKVLYEIGAIAPSLIKPHVKDFMDLLTSKNNRLQWGAMTALYEISKSEPELIYDALPTIVKAADLGSVITRDNAVKILIELAKVSTYTKDAFALLMEQLLKCPTNQFPMYAELSLEIADEKNASVLRATLEGRLVEIEKESKRKRIEKVLKKLA